MLLTFLVYASRNSFDAKAYLHIYGFPGGLDGKDSTCNAGDPDSIPGSRRFSQEGNGYPPYCRKGDPLPGPEMGSSVALRNELSEKIYMQTEQEILLGRGARAENSRVREPRRSALPCGWQSWVLW